MGCFVLAFRVLPDVAGGVPDTGRASVHPAADAA